MQLPLTILTFVPLSLKVVKEVLHEVNRVIHQEKRPQSMDRVWCLYFKLASTQLTKKLCVCFVTIG